MTAINHHEVHAEESAPSRLNPVPPPRGGAGRESVPPRAAIEAIRNAVTSWDRVAIHEHRFGGIEFRLGPRELGHLHGSFADLPFPRRERDELIAAGRASPHNVLPNSGWITAPTRTAAEVAEVIELFRRNYSRATGHRR